MKSLQQFINEAIDRNGFDTLTESMNRYIRWGWLSPDGRDIRGNGDDRHEDIAADKLGVRGNSITTDPEEAALAQGYVRYWVKYDGQSGYEFKHTSTPAVVKHLRQTPEVHDKVYLDVLSVNYDPEVFSVLRHTVADNPQAAIQWLNRLKAELVDNEQIFREDITQVANAQKMGNELEHLYPCDPITNRWHAVGDDGFFEFRVFDGHVRIQSIWAFDRKTGAGSRILKMLCDMADQYQVVLELTPKPFGTQKPMLSKSQLTAWYSRYGFKKDGQSMVRTPSENA